MYFPFRSRARTVSWRTCTCSAIQQYKQPAVCQCKNLHRNNVFQTGENKMLDYSKIIIILLIPKVCMLQNISKSSQNIKQAFLLTSSNICCHFFWQPCFDSKQFLDQAYLFCLSVCCLSFKFSLFFFFLFSLFIKLRVFFPGKFKAS